MKLTVIPSDSIIIKDGVALVCSFVTPKNLHALHWYGEHGTMEFTDKASEYFDDVSFVNPFPHIFDAEASRLAAEMAARPQPSAAQLRVMAIRARLMAIDLDSIRAMRAKSAGKGKVADDVKLAALDAEADTLRAELAPL